MKNKLGTLLLTIPIILTLNLWLLSKTDISQITTDFIRSTSQILALVGLVLLSTTMLLSTRMGFLEDIFGGLDKIYFIHRISGSLAFILLINHPLLLGIKALPNISIASLYLIPGNNLSYNLGIASLLILILSFIFMLFIHLPYHIWKLTHKFLGLAYLLGSIHAFLIPSDITSFLPLKYWMLLNVGIGSISAFYIIFLYRSLGPKFKYKILRIERTLDIINIYLKPTNRPLTFQPGQFIYIRFLDKQLGREYHPFSISSSTDDEILRISAKITGDYTLKLPLLGEGISAYVFGPYGKFHDLYSQTKPLVWIAGGIGITPFLGMIKHEVNSGNSRRIILFYSVRNKEEAVYLNEIKNVIQGQNRIELHEWVSSEMGRLTIDKIRHTIGNFSSYYFQLCGPNTMMESITKQLLAIGLSPKKIAYENFQFI